MTEKYQNLQDDVKKFHDERKRILLNDDLTQDQFRYYLDMTNEFFRAYPHNDTAQNMYKKLVQRDIESGDTRILNQLMKIGRASCRERVSQYVKIWVVAVS